MATPTRTKKARTPDDPDRPGGEVSSGGADKPGPETHRRPGSRALYRAIAKARRPQLAPPPREAHGEQASTGGERQDEPSHPHLAGFDGAHHGGAVVVELAARALSRHSSTHTQLEVVSLAPLGPRVAPVLPTASWGGRGTRDGENSRGSFRRSRTRFEGQTSPDLRWLALRSGDQPTGSDRPLQGPHGMAHRDGTRTQIDQFGDQSARAIGERSPQQGKAPTSSGNPVRRTPPGPMAPCPTLTQASWRSTVEPQALLGPGLCRSRPPPGGPGPPLRRLTIAGGEHISKLRRGRRHPEHVGPWSDETGAGRQRRPGSCPAAETMSASRRRSPSSHPRGRLVWGSTPLAGPNGSAGLWLLSPPGVGEPR